MKKRIITAIIAILAIITISISAFAENIDTTKIGDVNGDSKITASDARIVLRVAAHLDAETENILLYGDINKDGNISASDARAILRVAANLENIECVVNGHDMKEKVVSPNCSREGYTTKTCSRCNYTDGKKTDITAKTSHDYKLETTVKATCKSEGYDSYKCTVCGVTKKENVQPKAEHSFKKGSVIKGTCISDGYTEYKCSVCGTVEKRDITKAGGHKYEYVSKEFINTREFVGYKAVKKCACCNKKITAYEEGNSNIQIETHPISTTAAKNIQEKFNHYDYTVEGYDITGKKVVIYGNLKGIDADGYYYNLDGTLRGPCPHCGTTLGEGKEMCDGGCRLSWG